MKRKSETAKVKSYEYERRLWKKVYNVFVSKIYNVYCTFFHLQNGHKYMIKTVAINLIKKKAQWHPYSKFNSSMKWRFKVTVFCFNVRNEFLKNYL